MQSFSFFKINNNSPLNANVIDTCQSLKNQGSSATICLLRQIETIAIMKRVLDWRQEFAYVLYIASLTIIPSDLLSIAIDSNDLTVGN